MPLLLPIAPSLVEPVLPIAPALPAVPAVDPLPIDPFIEPELIEPDCELGLIVPLVLLLADPFGDCCALLPLALMPASMWPPGVATIPESDAPLLGVMVDPTAPVPAAPVWANARPDAASPRHKVLATNKRDILRTPGSNNTHVMLKRDGARSFR